MRLDKLLVVCTGNVCRSPMAAALFAAWAEKENLSLRVGSAGVAALVGQPPPAPAIALLHEHGLDISAHRARQITGELAVRYDLILTAEAQQAHFIEQNWMTLRGRVRRLGEWRGRDVHDAFGLPDEFYADCLTEIEACVQDWKEWLLT